MNIKWTSKVFCTFNRFNAQPIGCYAAWLTGCWCRLFQCLSKMNSCKTTSCMTPFRQHSRLLLCLLISFSASCKSLKTYQTGECCVLPKYTFQCFLFNSLVIFLPITFPRVCVTEIRVEQLKTSASALQLTSVCALRRWFGRLCLKSCVRLSSLRLKRFRISLLLRPPTLTMPACRNLWMPEIQESQSLDQTRPL